MSSTSVEGCCVAVELAGEGRFSSRRASGWTLLEVVVSLVLVAASVTVIVGIIPMGVTSLKKSESLQAATLYALELIEDAARADFESVRANRLLKRDVTLNKFQYRVARELYFVDEEEPSHLYDVVVNVSWDSQPAPVILRTRVYHP